MKNSSDTIGNRTRGFPTCSAVPQPTALPRASHNLSSGGKFVLRRHFSCENKSKIKIQHKAAVSRFITRPVNRGFERTRCYHVLSINPKSCITVLRNGGNFNRRRNVTSEKPLTLRRLMSYIYIYIYICGAPILDASRSHTTTQHSR